MLARCTNGLAMDGNCNAGGREKLSPFEGPQAASDSEGTAAAPSAITAPPTIWQHRIQPMAPAAPISTDTENSTFRHPAVSLWQAIRSPSRQRDYSLELSSRANSCALSCAP